MGKILIIGLDGATFDLIRPWAQQGKLPHLARLMEKGVQGELKSTYPPMSPPAWTSFMTGKNPGKHGIFDFAARKPCSYEIEFINARHRKATTIWKLMSDAGKRVCVLSLPITYPPEKINGIMISGLDAPGVGGLADPSAIYPPDLHQELLDKLGGYQISPNLEQFSTGQCDEMVEAALRTVQSKLENALYLYQKEAWDCFMITIGETDGVAHRLWKYHDPHSPLSPNRGTESDGADPILRIYAKVDHYMGRLCALAPEDTTIIVISDHGHGGVGNKAVYLNSWLEQKHFLKFKADTSGSPFSALFQRVAARGVLGAGRFGLKVLPAGFKKRVFRRTYLANRVASWLRFSVIDWKHTQAYSEETPYYPTVWINVQGREPAGTVKPGAEYEDLRDRIIRELYHLVDPETKQPVVKTVRRREEIYSGPYVEKFPDLIIEWGLDNGYSYRFKSSQGGRAGRAPIAYVDNKEQEESKSGDHRDFGIFIALGRELKASLQLTEVDILDIAPTVLYLLDLPLPADMDGKVLTQMLREEYLSSHPLCYASETGSGENISNQGPGYSPEDEKAIKARLQGLGYIE
ncbi:MAG: alkaline phosphatase family protein [Gammaproteobacteria bacterium]